jgi:2-polyprenyl-3-methyl-5-hydroxy-6-metoxy-1,4-benzoquinol methylase
MGCLITPEYVELNRKLHEGGEYGRSGSWRVPDVIQLAVQSDAKTILDYGCGQGYLKKNLTMPVREYDPAIAGKDSLPSPADLVVCTDVLEHVEPECLDSVLEHLQALTLKICFVLVHLTPAKKVLADGRNAHLIQKPPEWWEKKLGEYFDVISKADGDRESAFVLVAR